MDLQLTMTGRLTDCLLMSYRTPAESVRALLPEGLELVTRGPWAFWNVVSCRAVAMRPQVAGVAAPELLGVSYHHVAYRLLVQAMTRRADVRRGLYFLRSDADARLLGTFGNWTTDFKFNHARIQLTAEESDAGLQAGHDASAGRYELRVDSNDGRADARVELEPGPAELGPDSCFATLQDAREFLKYEPYALAVAGRPGRRQLRIAEVQRDESAWREHPRRLRRQRLDYFQHLGQTEARLELATRVEPLDYIWKLGACEPLLGQAAEPLPAPAAPRVRSA